MGEIETIIADIDRQQDLRILSYLISHDHGIEDLLIIFDIDLNPATVPDRNSVLLPTPDALGADSIPGGNDHDNGKPKRRCTNIRFKHKSKPLPRSPCKNPSSCQGGSLEHA